MRNENVEKRDTAKKQLTDIKVWKCKSISSRCFFFFQLRSFKRHYVKRLSNPWHSFPRSQLNWNRFLWQVEKLGCFSLSSMGLRAQALITFSSIKSLPSHLYALMPRMWKLRDETERSCHWDETFYRTIVNMKSLSSFYFFYFCTFDFASNMYFEADKDCRLEMGIDLASDRLNNTIISHEALRGAQIENTTGYIRSVPFSQKLLRLIAGIKYSNPVEFQ